MMLLLMLTFKWILFIHTQDSHVEVAQSVYGRGTGTHAVRFIVNDILGKGHYGLVSMTLLHLV